MRQGTTVYDNVRVDICLEYYSVALKEWKVPFRSVEKPVVATASAASGTDR